MIGPVYGDVANESGELTSDKYCESIGLLGLLAF